MIIESSITKLCIYSMIRCKSAVNSSRVISIHPLVHSWAQERNRFDIAVQQKRARFALELAARAVRLAKATWVWESKGFEQRTIPHLRAVFAAARKYLAIGPKPSDNLPVPPLPLHRDQASDLHLYMIIEMGEAWYFRTWGKVEDTWHGFKVLRSSDIESASENWGLVYSLGSILRGYGDSQQAESMYRWALAQQRLPKKHPAALLIVGDLARSILNQGRYEEAEAWYKWIFYTRSNILGSTHPATMGALMGIAGCHFRRGAYDEAEKLYLTAYTERAKKLGPHDPLTLNVAINLILLYEAKGDYDSTLEWRNKLHIGRRRGSLGEYTGTLNSTERVAMIFEKLGGYHTGKELHDRLRVAYEKYLETKDPRILTTAPMWGDNHESLEFLSLALAGYEESLGRGRRARLSSMMNLVVAYSSLNQWEVVWELAALILDGNLKEVGVDHPDTVLSIRELVTVFLKWTKRSYQGHLFQEILSMDPRTHHRPDDIGKLYRKVRIASLFWVLGRTEQGRELAWRIVGLPSQNQPDTFRGMEYLAFEYQELGQWEQAAELVEQIVELRKRVLGHDDPDTLFSMHCLGVAYYKLGRLEEAMVLEAQTVELRKRVLGHDDPNTLSSMHNLALTYERLGMLEEAVVLDAQTVELRKRVLGPDILTGRYYHPFVYRKLLLGDAVERGLQTVEFGLQTVELRKRVLGHDDPFTLYSMHNLALTYERFGRLEEAADLGVQTVELRRRVLGHDDPDTLFSMHNLALTYERLGRLEEAAELGVQTMELRKRALGHDDPNTLYSIRSLAFAYERLGQLEEAVELSVQTVELRKRASSHDDPNTLFSMHNLALTNERLGRLEEAADLGAQTLELRKKVLGHDDLNNLSSIYILAFAYERLGRLEEAVELGVQTVELRKRALGHDDPDTLFSMHNLALTYERFGRLGEAVKLGVQTIELRKRVLGRDDPNTLSSIRSLAFTFEKLGWWQGAAWLYAAARENTRDPDLFI